MQVNCLHPEIILNPLAAELVAQFCNYTIRGVTTTFRSFKSRLYDFKTSSINPKRLKIQREDIDSCFVTNRSTGELYPLYLEVPCGHCECCKQTKMNSFVQRCKLETQCYNSLPIFLTLTYNEEKKPKDGVNVRDVQLFFKRLRVNLYRKGYREKIRYVLCAEYGSRTHRPHYHAILWNLHESCLLDFRSISQEIERSWNNGFVVSRFVDPSNDKAFFYTAKYLCKDCDVPEGCKKPFMVCSNRGGGIGSAFIDRLTGYIKNSFGCVPRYTDKFTGKTHEIFLDRYSLNRLVPSFCRSLPPYLKSDVREFLFSYKVLRDFYNVSSSFLSSKATEFVDFFKDYFYCPSPDSFSIRASSVSSLTEHYRNCVFTEHRISRAISKGKEFYEKAKQNHHLRDYFLSKLFLAERSEVDLGHKAYLFRRSMALAKEREVL